VQPIGHLPEQSVPQTRVSSRPGERPSNEWSNGLGIEELMAVMAMRFDAETMADQWSEICAYGTAVKVSPKEGAEQRGTGSTMTETSSGIVAPNSVMIAVSAGRSPTSGVHCPPGRGEPLPLRVRVQAVADRGAQEHPDPRHGVRVVASPSTRASSLCRSG
jgi:Putative heavy-metal-binding